MIGVVGGMGPHAGLDLIGKILDQTLAASDQDHLPLALLSLPAEVPDRTRFLMGQDLRNPAVPIARILYQLEALGATVAGIPCNTSHAPAIFGTLCAALRSRGSRLNLLNMVEETVRFAVEILPAGIGIGLLSTYGTHKAGIYRKGFAGTPLTVVTLPDDDMIDLVHLSIYHHEWGLKACPHPVSAEASERLTEACRRLEERGAQAVVLGCTELPFALHEERVGDLVTVDPALVLARALIRNVRPERLRPLPDTVLASP